MLTLDSCACPLGAAVQEQNGPSRSLPALPAPSPPAVTHSLGCSGRGGDMVSLKRSRELCDAYKKRAENPRGRGLESLISSNCFLCRSQLFPYNSQAVQSLGAIPRSSLFYCCSPSPWKIPVLFYVYRGGGFFSKLENSRLPLVVAEGFCSRYWPELGFSGLFLPSPWGASYLKNFLRFLSKIFVCTVICGGCKPNSDLTYFFLLAFLGFHIIVLWNSEKLGHVSS